IDTFHDLAQKSRTRVLSFLNISRVGLKVKNELADLSTLSFDALEAAVEKYTETIVGLKARMSASVVGDNGMEPLMIAKQFTRELNVPLLVHTGNAPPYLNDIADLLEQGDIITHIYNDKPGNNMFANNPSIQPAL